MAFLAVRGKGVGDMIRILGGQIFLLVARYAFGGQRRKVALLLILMTTPAFHQVMPAH